MLYRDVTSTGKPLHENKYGGHRDSAEDKLDYTLVPIPSLKRLVQHYINGLKKYGRDNWKKLFLPDDIARYEQSMYRHLIQYLEGMRDEDHLAAIVWNAMSLMYFEEKPFSGTMAEPVAPVDIEAAKTNISNFRKQIFAQARQCGKTESIRAAIEALKTNGVCEICESLIADNEDKETVAFRIKDHKTGQDTIIDFVVHKSCNTKHANLSLYEKINNLFMKHLKECIDED